MASLASSVTECNRCRYDNSSPQGHYESYFQRANHPSKAQAFWIRYTVFSPAGKPQEGLGEVWSIWFDGDAGEIAAAKSEFPLHTCRFSPDGLDVEIGGSTLKGGRLVGAAQSPGRDLSWDLTYEGGQAPLLLLPERLYSIGFPKAKALVGVPNAKYYGAVTVNGATHKIDGWQGSQNHNWGSQHTDYYAWGQIAGFDDEPESFLECSTAQLRLGPLWTPPMTLVVLRYRGEEYRLNSLLQAVKARGRFAYFKWTFASAQGKVSVDGRIHAPASAFVGLRYYNPPGGTKTCLNSKIATCELTLHRQGELPVKLKSANRAAFEILTDDASHGVAVVA
ncbi:MAG: hypothetical protein HYV63_01205 [Candidatus Schekmanbacteria bacterium]|nr:hypothetical protein [Candidatus Schekmanbacteria bacterium]